ncbi:Hypothetical protein SMAX5B_021682 [Scophthalmus maximus]|uniref:Uncharacterized protein n=1 Tax=Scophthalmus maximus TaxID=52904 RepID=A0A2U9C801_SCOMX|nr:Hypothetical protein SMAX5B_021682 [Scophthalmus maximus]
MGPGIGLDQEEPRAHCTSVRSDNRSEDFIPTKRHRFLLRGERHQQPLRCLHHEPPNESGHWPCGVQDVAMPVVASRPLRPLTYTAAKQRSL